jgi:23S rRNA (cytosine1962-C5)-methyltransferase
MSVALPSLTLRGGPPVHPYVYNKRVMRTDRSVRDGDVVRVLTREGRPCGFGFAHSQSQIAVRMLSYDPEVVPDEAWLRARLGAAEALRRDVLRLPEVTDAWRVVHAEGDGLSGLVVDRYGPVAVVGLFSLGWMRRADELTRALREVLGVEHVVLRADEKTERQEGFQAPPAPRLKRVRIHERDVVFEVDPVGGHKTGFFLDQRENRERLGALARGRSLFDGMTYTGGFALAAARAGARQVRGMDLDEEAVAQARRNLALNALPAGSEVRFDHGDVFDALRAYVAGPEADRPEVLVVDPAKWARDRAGLGAAMAKYRDLNRLAFEAVRPGGVVLTCSCSGLVSEEMYLAVLRDAALDVRREVRILSVTGAASDHPVAGAFPEGRYLKAVTLMVGGAGSGPGRSERASRPEDAWVGEDATSDVAPARRRPFRGGARD